MLNWEYSAAPHFQFIHMQLSVPNVPLHATLPETWPPKFCGTWKGRPVRKISPLVEIGTVVTQVLLVVSNVVEEHVALGEKIICPFGTGRL